MTPSVAEMFGQLAPGFDGLGVGRVGDQGDEDVVGAGLELLLIRAAIDAGSPQATRASTSRSARWSISSWVKSIRRKLAW